jgi:hypothetical protein
LYRNSDSSFCATAALNSSDPATIVIKEKIRLILMSIQCSGFLLTQSLAAGVGRLKLAENCLRGPAAKPDALIAGS